MNTCKEIISDHLAYRKQLVKLAKSDIKKTYSGAVLGWAGGDSSGDPDLRVLVRVYRRTAQGSDVDGYPFFLWLIAGMIPWYYMRDMITGGAGSIRKYRYLVTKIKFPISTIPTFVSLSCLAVHIGLLLIMILIFVGFGYPPTIYYLQLPVYMLMMFAFFTTWGLFSGVLSAISQDFLNLVKSLTQALFWLSGILYDAGKIEIVWVKKVLLFNPVTICANGYRNVFIKHVWFWETPEELRNYVIVLIAMGALAVWAYGRLKKEIPDVL